MKQTFSLAWRKKNVVKYIFHSLIFFFSLQMKIDYICIYFCFKVRETMTSSILSTDMAEHFEFLNKFRRVLAARPK